MPFVANFPFFCILITMAGGVICYVLKGKYAYRFTVGVVLACNIMTAFLVAHMYVKPEEITYLMGHFSAPWGNEIRFGPLEALIALVLNFVMLMIITLQKEHIFKIVKKNKLNLFYVMVCLMLSSLNALIYTNDLFTSFVFIEINTLCACGFMIARENGKTIGATIKYLIMSLLGSGLFLISIILLYDLTGHLLMPDVGRALARLILLGEYQFPITIIVGLLSASMAIKSGLFPFHSWMSHAYNNALNASNAISSGLVVKGFIILLIKIFYRVIGIYNVNLLHAGHVLFAFGILAIIVGSFDAIKEHNIKRMLAYSSVGQIGYIYVGISLGTEAGMMAACFTIISHSLSKALLFISCEGLMYASDNSKYIEDLRGSALRNPLAGIGFAIGGFSLIGIPILPGFVSKYMLATAAIESPSQMWFVLAAMIVSTVLTANYFIKFILRIFNRSENFGKKTKYPLVYTIGMTIFILVNFSIGFLYEPIVSMIASGLELL